MEIPGYRIENKIAEGGMADVYRAVQESLDRPVALKILKQTDDPSFSRRFLEEGRTIAALRHPNIVNVYDIGVTDEHHFISMEFVDGGDLDSRIEKGLKPIEAVAVVRKLADCLNYVHSQGVIHRDIKPGNILFRDDGEPLLTDFGIAKQLQSNNKLTLDGVALGSPYYLSPEQGQCKKVDARSDIYSLGIVLYEMLTGRLPFQGKAPIDTILLHLQEPLPHLRKSLQHFQPLLDRMTAKEPKKRFRNCSALLKAIDELATELTDTSTIVKRPSAKGKAEQGEQGAKGRTETGTMTMEMDAFDEEGGSRSWLWPVLIIIAAGLIWLETPGKLLSLIDFRKPGSEASSLAFDWGRVKERRAASADKQLEQYLLLANERRRKDMLMLPVNDNALFYYEKALEIDGANRTAREGIEAVAGRYAELAEAVLAKGEAAKAVVYVERGLRVLSNDPRLLSLRNRISPDHPVANKSDGEWQRWVRSITAWFD